MSLEKNIVEGWEQEIFNTFKAKFETFGLTGLEMKLVNKCGIDMKCENVDSEYLLLHILDDFGTVERLFIDMFESKFRVKGFETLPLDVMKKFKDIGVKNNVDLAEKLNENFWNYIDDLMNDLVDRRSELCDTVD